MNEERLKAWLESRKLQKAGRNVTDLFTKLRTGDRNALSAAITILESTLPEDQEIATGLIQKCLPYAGNSLRIGITGVPGVGKSTFIESFGQEVLRYRQKLAVLAIDPSSERSGGSILGDKTRMEQLSHWNGSLSARLLPVRLWVELPGKRENPLSCAKLPGMIVFLLKR